MRSTELGGLGVDGRRSWHVGGNRLLVDALLVKQVNAEGPDTISGEPASLGDIEGQLRVVHSFARGEIPQSGQVIGNRRGDDDKNGEHELEPAGTRAFLKFVDELLEANGHGC